MALDDTTRNWLLADSALEWLDRKRADFS
jgi:hypothetical protein